MNPIRQQHQDERGKCWRGMSWIWRFGDAIDQGRRHVLHALDVHMTRCSISVAVGISKICSVLSCKHSCSLHARYCARTWITALHRGEMEMQLLFSRPVVMGSRSAVWTDTKFPVTVPILPSGLRSDKLGVYYPPHTNTHRTHTSPRFPLALLKGESLS